MKIIIMQSTILYITDPILTNLANTTGIFKETTKGNKYILIELKDEEY
jgi:hypothetical protein